MNTISIFPLVGVNVPVTAVCSSTMMVLGAVGSGSAEGVGVAVGVGVGVEPAPGFPPVPPPPEETGVGVGVAAALYVAFVTLTIVTYEALTVMIPALELFVRKPLEFIEALAVRFTIAQVMVTVVLVFPLTSNATAVNCWLAPTVNAGAWGVSNILVTVPAITEALVEFVTEELATEVMLNEELPAAEAL